MPSIASRSTRRISTLVRRLLARQGARAPTADFQSPDREGAGKGSPLPHGRASEKQRPLVRAASSLARRVLPARRPHILPRAVRTKPWLLISYTVFLVCLIAIVIGWHGQPAADPADFDLHADNSSFNLQKTSAPEPARPAAPAPEPTVSQELPPPPKVEPHLIPALEIPPAVQVKTEDSILDLPPPQEHKAPAKVPPPFTTKLETPPAIVTDAIQLTEVVAVPQAIAEPDVSDPICDWHRGDVPMIRNWHKVLGYQAVLAAAMLTSQAGADDNAKNTSDKPAATELKAIKAQLDKIEESTKSLDTIKQGVGSLKEEIKLLRESNTSEFKAVNKRVDAMEKKLASLEAKLNARVANFPPASGNAAPATGHMRLVNGFNRKATVFLNEIPHPLDPGQVQELNMPAGNYSFWVLVDGFAMVQPPTTGTLTAGGARTIEIYSR